MADWFHDCSLACQCIIERERLWKKAKGSFFTFIFWRGFVNSFPLATVKVPPIANQCAFISIYQLLSKKMKALRKIWPVHFFLSYFLGKILQVSKALKNWDTAFKYALVKYQKYLWFWHVSKHLSLLGKRLVKVLLYLSRTENHLTLQRCNLPWILLD